MKRSAKNEVEILEIINKVQAQLSIIERKVDMLVSRSSTQARPSPTPAANNNSQAPKSNDHNNSRPMYKAVCADCKKECTIPFKPSGERPVYCQECFSRRKVISMSRIGLDDQPKEASPTQLTLNKAPEEQKAQAKSKKRSPTAKKPVTKKKTAPKKK